MFVACGKENDCIIIEKDGKYILFAGDKKSMFKAITGDLDACLRKGCSLVGEVDVTDKPISNMQIKLLAPEYPTTALTWHGANCCICWKTWKEIVDEALRL